MSEERRASKIRAMRAMIGRGELASARREAVALLAHAGRDAEVHFCLGLIAHRAQHHRAAIQHAKDSLAIEKRTDAYLLVASSHRALGETEVALEACDRALEQAPGHVHALLIRAGVLEEAGRYDEARAVVDPLVAAFERDAEPLPSALRFELAKLLVQDREYQRAVEVIDELLGEDSVPDDLTRLTCFLKAKALDRSGQFGAAFEAASLANGIGRVAFDPRLYEDQVTALIETWSEERMGRFPRSACQDDLPVFVAGMPRSGTSLIDQIIDAHPEASGVGELSSIEAFAMRLARAYRPDREPPACFGALGADAWTRVANGYAREVRDKAPPGTRRVVNKALGNNKLVGLIACLFPRTRIIHAQRDPRDVAISCYMGGFNNRLHAWTTRLEWIASAWEQSQRMMEHWRRAVGVPILDVRYEELVRDPGSQFPRLIEFLGLEWDGACLGFHKSRRTVRTLSYDQVNRPLYTTSAGRHANYGAQIAGVEFPAY